MNIKLKKSLSFANFVICAIELIFQSIWPILLKNRKILEGSLQKCTLIGIVWHANLDEGTIVSILNRTRSNLGLKDLNRKTIPELDLDLLLWKIVFPSSSLSMRSSVDYYMSINEADIKIPTKPRLHLGSPGSPFLSLDTDCIEFITCHKFENVWKFGDFWKIWKFWKSSKFHDCYFMIMISLSWFWFHDCDFMIMIVISWLWFWFHDCDFMIMISWLWFHDCDYNGERNAVKVDAQLSPLRKVRFIK